MIPSFRFFTYASLIICGSVFVVSEFILKLPIVNDSFRQKVANELSQTFSRDITVGSIKGGFLSTLVLDDVTISSDSDSFEFPMAEIDKIIVNLSPRVFLGNISEGIQTATFDGVTLKGSADPIKRGF